MVVKVNIEVHCKPWNSYNDIWDFIEFKGFALFYMFKVFENSADQFYNVELCNFILSIVVLLLEWGPQKKRPYDPLNANCSLNV